MKKFLTFFTKAGVLKLFIAFVLIGLFVYLSNETDKNIFKYLFCIPAAYIVIEFLLFFGAAFYNTIKDFFTKK